MLNATGGNVTALHTGFFVAPLSQTVQSNVLFYNSSTKEITYDVIGNISYTPNNASNYNGTITTIKQALDELAARIKLLGG